MSWIDDRLLHRATEWCPGAVFLTREIFGPGVRVGVKLNQRDRPGSGCDGADLGKRYRVIPADTERRYTCSHERSDGLGYPIQRLLQVAGHDRGVANVCDPEALENVDPAIGIDGPQH